MILGIYEMRYCVLVYCLSQLVKAESLPLISALPTEVSCEKDGPFSFGRARISTAGVRAINDRILGKSRGEVRMKDLVEVKCTSNSSM